MAEKNLNLTKIINLQIQQAHQKSSRRKKENCTKADQNEIYVNFRHGRVEGNSHKSTRWEKRHIVYKREKNAVDFS